VTARICTEASARLKVPCRRPLRDPVLVAVLLLLIIPTSLTHGRPRTLRGRRNRRSTHPDREACVARTGDVHGTGDARIEAVNGTQDLEWLRGVVLHVTGEQAWRPRTQPLLHVRSGGTVTVPDAMGPGESVESSRHHLDLEVRYRRKR
jgi:hypothetical protein